jgi:iron complex outermembrane recepter protein
MFTNNRGKRRSTLDHRLRSSAAIAVLFGLLPGMPAWAQSAPSTQPSTQPSVGATTQVAQAAPQAETIEVTGTRIKNTDAASANPITVVSSEDIQKSEAVTVEQFLRKLPDVDFTGGTSQNDNNGGNGASNLGLRNLGPQRTLILVNGQRFVNTDSQGKFTAVDLNNIPTSMIDHIEILRDGASSAYGADAIGGVINIITKQHFNGVEIGGGVGETSYGDGLRYNVYSTVGADFDRGNILVNVSHDNQDPILGADRAWATNQHPEAGVNAFDALSGRAAGAQATINPSGTGAGADTRFFYFGSGPNAAATNPILASQAFTLGNPIAGGAFKGGQLPPGDIAFPGGGVDFDFTPTQGLVTGLERTQVNFTTHYDLAPNITALLEAFYTDRQSSEVLNPEPVGAGTPTPQFPSAFLVPAFLPGGGLNPANPTTAAFGAANGIAGYNPAALFGAGNVNTPVSLSTRRFENGNRLYTDDINTSRIRAGLEGTLLDKYDWSVGYLFGKSDAEYDIANEANFFHISQQLGINPCGTQAAQGCSIANYFGNNSLTPAQAKYSVFDNDSKSTLEQNDAYGNISGPVYQLPAGPLNAAFGFEYRTDSVDNTPNSVTSNGDAAVFQEPTQGSYATASVYGELNVPILSNLPFVKALTGDVSSRYDYNTTFGRALTYKIGLDYAIDDDFRLRGNHSTGFRAPQVKELFAGAESDAATGTDPCAVNPLSAACQADFKASGLPGSIKPPSVSQLPAQFGGNPNLKPETSNEWTFGTVVTPHWVPGLTVTTDYYSVLVRNEISTYDPNALLADCYNGAAYVVSQAVACNLVGFGHRAADGSQGLINLDNVNIGDELTQGIDFTASYGFDAAKAYIPVPGHITMTGSVNYLLKDTITAGGASVKNAGTFNVGIGGGTAEPRFKALLDTTYAQDAWSADFTERYYGSAHNVSTALSPGDFEGNQVPGVFYSDISFSYKYKNVGVTVGVDNLFDKDPPFVGTANLTLTDAGYDFTGRFVYSKFTVTF